MNSAYDEGRIRAEEDFGLRIAADMFRRPIPHGDMNVGAERLAKTLSDLESPIRPPKEQRVNRLDRATRWGQPGSPYGTGASTHDYSGIGRDGAAI